MLNCQPLLLGENYTEVKAWQLKFAQSDSACLIPMSTKKYWNKSTTAKVLLENLVRNDLKENKLWKKTFKSAVW